MKQKSTVHIVAAELDGIQPCMRCGIVLWRTNDTGQSLLPVGAKVCLSGNVVEFVGNHPSDREFGIRPGHDHV